MSESPERPRMTRRQLREMEQARQAAESQAPEAEQASSAAEASGDFAVPPPTRPTMTRRQLREAAQREAEERAAQERAAQEREAEQARAAEERRLQQEQQRAAEEQRRAAEKLRAEEQRQAEAKRKAEAQRKAEAEQAAEAQRQEEAKHLAEQKRQAEEKRQADEKRLAEQRAAQERERRSAWQRAQDAPPPALETEDSPRVPADPQVARRAVADARRSVLPGADEQQAVQRQGIQQRSEQLRPGFYPAPQNWHAVRPHTPGQGEDWDQVSGDQASGPSVQSGAAATPNVRPPAGVNAIRTVEETGELSPILHTAPGESVWPSIPGATSGEDATAQEDPAPITPASTAVPFRAPAWGARTSAAVETADEAEAEDQVPPTVSPRVNTQRAPETGGISGMSATPTRWPAGGASAPNVGPPSGSVFPGAPSAGTHIPSGQVEDDEDEEEYEPMFTWLRLLVLMIIAFVLGALVWLIIGQSDAGAGVASMAVITGLKVPLGE